jgi:hypothetical protein
MSVMQNYLRELPSHLICWLFSYDKLVPLHKYFKTFFMQVNSNR